MHIPRTWPGIKCDLSQRGLLVGLKLFVSFVLLVEQIVAMMYLVGGRATITAFSCQKPLCESGDRVIAGRDKLGTFKSPKPGKIRESSLRTGLARPSAGKVRKLTRSSTMN
ncbi:hypothetical protein B0H16DRAFT_723294 [Mycena metata]|uniref:Uncharacterized protein n=1 Tax=Mycena metata TaxID=1033252 RepID=A0AAD7NX96_9AGAR|nr:hypothetical protein B0H16DRAFT_723294 [Mycena metata]